MDTDSTLVFVDGENLSLRYQDMLDEGRTPRPDNIWIEDCFIWNQRVLDTYLWNIKRLAYYTSIVGDDPLVRSFRERIAATTFKCTFDQTQFGTSTRTAQIVPFVRKRSSRSRKESICDIAIAVDVMRACYRDHAEAIWLLSGDGDFVQLVTEVVHAGKRAYVSAFSSGLNDELRFVVDEFLSLDNHFFITEQEQQIAPTQAQGVEGNHDTTSPPLSQGAVQLPDESA
jgi:uncharacterized LabA/DUF88 family protein